MEIETLERTMTRLGSMPEVPSLPELQALAVEAFAWAEMGDREPKVSFGFHPIYGRTVVISFDAPDGLHALQHPLCRGEFGCSFRCLAHLMAKGLGRA